MEQYKIINADLVEQVQKQRLEICYYRKKVLELNAQLQEEYENRVLEKNRYLAEAHRSHSKLKCAVSVFLRSLDINANFEIGDDELNMNGTLDSSPAESQCRRRSTNEMSSELCHFSAVTRQSIPVSPSRRTRSLSCGVKSVDNCADQRQMEATTTPQPRRTVDIGLESSSPEEEIPVENAHPTPELSGHLLPIIEESDGEDMSLSTICNSTSFNLHTPITKQTRQCVMDSTLRDVTNSRDIVLTGSPKITLRRVMRKPSVPREEENTAIEIEDSPKVIFTRRNRRQAQEPDVSVQPARRAIRLSPSFLELTGLDVTPCCSSLEFSYDYGIANAPGSTPQKVITRDTEKGDDDFEAYSRASSRLPEYQAESRRRTERSQSSSKTAEETTLSGRPMRYCRPTSLREPNLISKVRNETNEKSLSKHKKLK